MGSPDPATAQSSGELKPVVPSISLPKAGGAIRGMGEKFAANPVTGTGSMSVPIATSPGRSGFGPQLSLSYDSGAGNGPFGFGWSLSLPAITRKTENDVAVLTKDLNSNGVCKVCVQSDLFRPDQGVGDKSDSDGEVYLLIHYTLDASRS